MTFFIYYCLFLLQVTTVHKSDKYSVVSNQVGARVDTIGTENAPIRIDASPKLPLVSFITKNHVFQFSVFFQFCALYLSFLPDCCFTTG